MFCSGCGASQRVGAAKCRECGLPADSPAGGDGPGSNSLFLDTIRLPGQSRQEAQATRVRPALAVLYRIAAGPGADYYTPRLLRSDQTGRDVPGWHWPALLFPGIWAFYRRLWLMGAICALLPIAGALAFAALAPRIDASGWAFAASAILIIWILPGVIPAMVANALVVRRVRREVRRAELRGGSVSKAATLLAMRQSTSIAASVFLGGGLAILAMTSIAPIARSIHAEQTVRSRLAGSLAAMRPLQLQIEQMRGRATGARRPEARALPALRDVAPMDTVSVNPTTGRVRLNLGAAIPELEGKTILLAPATDVGQGIRWLCIPVDIPARYLPRDCRKG